MLELAASKWPIDKSMSLLIGDKHTDIEYAEKFCIKEYLFKDTNFYDFIQSSINIQSTVFYFLK